MPVRPWASRFTHNFPTTKTTTTGLPLYSFSPNNSPSPSRLRKQPPSRRTTPVLTLALLKLDENLGKFCELLEDPTYDHVQKACAILDSTVATANAGNQSTNNQNGRDDFPPSNTPPNAESPRTSPSISPIASWLIGGPYHQAAEMSPTSSAVALEGEFEKFCSPLIVFASSEGIYSSLGHAESSDLARNLTRLYERIAVDIQLVRETLCDPFLPNTEIASPPFLNPLHNSSKNHNINNTKKNSALPGKSSKLLAYKEIAARLATSLDIIRNICICRCKLIEQQKILWSSPDFIDTAEAASFIAQTILPLLQMPKYDVTSDTSAASVQVHAARLFKNLAQEAEAWFYLMEMTRSIEQAR